MLYLRQFYNENHFLAPMTKGNILIKLTKRALALFMVPRKVTFSMALFLREREREIEKRDREERETKRDRERQTETDRES